MLKKKSLFFKIAKRLKGTWILPLSRTVSFCRRETAVAGGTAKMHVEKKSLFVKIAKKLKGRWILPLTGTVSSWHRKTAVAGGTAKHAC